MLDLNVYLNGILAELDFLFPGRKHRVVVDTSLTFARWGILARCQYKDCDAVYASTLEEARQSYISRLTEENVNGF